MVFAGVCASALCLASAHAQDSRFYINADAGGAVTMDTRVKEFFGSVDPGTKVKFDPGVRLGFKGGYRVTDWFAVEGETGIIDNNIKSISGANIDGNASFANIPFLLNARFELPHGKCPITPYFGGGAGGAASVFNIEHHIDLNGVRLRGSDSATVFAYQAFAGLRYALNDQMGIAVEYHYFATTGPTWSADALSTASDHMRFLGVQSHMASVAFNYRF